MAYTNKLRFGAFRGFGDPQITFAGEQQIDEIAERLGSIRSSCADATCMRAGRPLVRRPGGRLQRPGRMPRHVERESGWDARARAVGRRAAAGKRRGFGVALSPRTSAACSPPGAIVRMLEDGTVVLNTGAVDIGQGSDTVLTQICAEALQVPIERVAHRQPRHRRLALQLGHHREPRHLHRPAARWSAPPRRSSGKLKEHAGEMLECAVDDLELRPGGAVGIKGVPEQA